VVRVPLDLLLRAYSTVLYFAIALEDWPAFAEWTVFTSGSLTEWTKPSSRGRAKSQRSTKGLPNRLGDNGEYVKGAGPGLSICLERRTWDRPSRDRRTDTASRLVEADATFTDEGTHDRAGLVQRLESDGARGTAPSASA